MCLTPNEDVVRRTLTRDPNETAVPLLTAMVSFGEKIALELQGPSIEGNYRDGLNAFQRMRSEPIVNRDPSGLMSQDDIAQEVMIRGVGLIGGLMPFFEIIEERNFEINDIIEAALDGKIDGALRDYEVSQNDRWDLLSKSWRTARAGLSGQRAGDAIAELGEEFFSEVKATIVYIGYDPKTNIPRYVGITDQNLKVRERQHGGNYDLKSYMTTKNRRQGRAIEQYILEKNPHFDNKINCISRLNRWYRSAMKWAKKALRGRKVHF